MSVLRSLVKKSKEINFYKKKIVVIIIFINITLIFKIKFSFIKSLINSLRTYHQQDHKIFVFVKMTFLLKLVVQKIINYGYIFYTLLELEKYSSKNKQFRAIIKITYIIFARLHIQFYINFYDITLTPFIKISRFVTASAYD